MQPKLKISCAVAALAALTTSLYAATANTSDGTSDNFNPYGVITDRNVFHLNPPPPPHPPEQAKPVEMPKVYLDGMVRIGDAVQVLFSIPPKDNKGDTAYFKLAPGEKDGVLELVKILPNQEDVEVLVNGTPMTLSILKDNLVAAEAKFPGGGKQRMFTPPPAPGAAPVAAAAPEQSSAIIAGGGRESSSYGNVAVGGGGGGGVTTIGGGNNAGSSFGGGSGVSIGGGGTGGSAYGGGYGATGSSLGSGGVSVSGGSSTGSSLGAQLASALSGASSPGQAPANNIPPEPTVSPQEQAANIAAANQDGKGPPLPPSIQQMLDGTYQPPSGRRGAGGGMPVIP